MNENILCAIIGIVGAILGTIIGWLLNGLSQRGKLYFFVSQWDYQFQFNDVGSMASSLSKEQTELFQYSLKLDIYNSSGETQIIRNFEVQFFRGDSLIWKSIPKDQATRHMSGPVAFYDEISSFNILPKTVVSIEVHDGVWNKGTEFPQIFDVDCAYMIYTDQRNKRRKVLIKKENLSDFFDKIDSQG